MTVKLYFQLSLLQTSVSHDPSEIIHMLFWKQVIFLISVENSVEYFCANQCAFFVYFKVKYLFKIESFWNIINIFTVTSGPFIASLLNKI